MTGWSAFYQITFAINVGGAVSQAMKGNAMWCALNAGIAAWFLISALRDMRGDTP